VREPARRAHAAQQRYLHYLQRSLSCLTNAIWLVAPPPDARGDERALTVSGEPIRLRRDEGATLLLYANQRFDLIEDERFPGEWKARTHGYVYSIYVETPDEDKRPRSSSRGIGTRLLRLTDHSHTYTSAWIIHSLV
jgi:hypothetical protein